MADEVRMIDAELLTTNIAQIAKNCARSDAQKALIGRILFMIENMPTVEAEPVKHGRWIWLKNYRDCEGDIYSQYKCSCCDFVVGNAYSIEDMTPFCGNCGADMRGEN